MWESSSTPPKLLDLIPGSQALPGNPFLGSAPDCPGPSKIARPNLSGLVSGGRASKDEFPGRAWERGVKVLEFLGGGLGEPSLHKEDSPNLSLSRTERMNVRLRLMTIDDIPEAMRLKDLAGWNQTAADWERFLFAGPEGCFVAKRKGRVVGTSATIVYQGRFAWIGMVIVDRQFRGQGIGTALLERAIQYLDSRNIPCMKLDATPQGRVLDESSGSYANTTSSGGCSSANLARLLQRNRRWKLRTCCGLIGRFSGLTGVRSCVL